MHPEALQFLTDHAVPSARKVLDVGGRNINGTPRPLYPAADYTALDVIDGYGVDVVGDITTWDGKGKFDVVICAEVLEHAANWRQVVRCCWDRLKVGGTLLLTCATTGRDPHSTIDGGLVRPDEHYENIPASKLTGALTRLGAADLTVEDHPDRGDLYVACRRPRAKAKA